MQQDERRWYQRMSTRMQWMAVGVAAVLLFGVIGLMAGGSSGSPQPNAAATPVVDGAAQDNAAALCNDGSYSSATRQRDACTSQGGVRVWLRPDLPP